MCVCVLITVMADEVCAAPPTIQLIVRTFLFVCLCNLTLGQIRLFRYPQTSLGGTCSVLSWFYVQKTVYIPIQQVLQ
jgi:hypothetical protein